jgi:hypothetical protein
VNKKEEEIKIDSLPEIEYELGPGSAENGIKQHFKTGVTAHHVGATEAKFVEQDDEPIKYSAYIDLLKSYEKIRAESIKSFDRTLLTLSAGAFSLTVVFLEKIGRPYDVLTFLLLALSWSAFVLSSILNLSSYYTAIKNMNFRIADLQKVFEQQLSLKSSKVSKYRITTEVLNFLTLALFVAGALFFTVYALLIQHR